MGTNTQVIVVISLSDTPVFAIPPQAGYTTPVPAKALKAHDEARLKKALTIISRPRLAIRYRGNSRQP